MTDKALEVKRQNAADVVAGQLGETKEALLQTLRNHVFTADPPFSDSELRAALVVAAEYRLNPILREIYLIRSKGKLLVAIGIDGWLKMLNAQPTFDGLDVEEVKGGDGDIGIKCTIYRTDRERPTSITEWLSENERDTEPWRKCKRRMLRHRAIIQCARIAFGFGYVDADEAESLRELSPSEYKVEPMARPSETEPTPGALFEAGDQTQPRAPRMKSDATTAAGGHEKPPKKQRAQRAAPKGEAAAGPQDGPAGTDKRAASMAAAAPPKTVAETVDACLTIRDWLNDTVPPGGVIEDVTREELERLPRASLETYWRSFSDLFYQRVELLNEVKNHGETGD